MAALRTAILGQREPGSLCAAARADVDLLPHQLEPALAVVRHGARRLLLADAVGLGKTIEAGLVLAELRARSALDCVLVLAPPGLCDQWCAELAGRFGMETVVADAGWLRSLRPVLPASINPWSVPGVRVASLDFAKRPEVRRSIERVPWDAVIVDEAHIAAGDSERRAAAHAFAARARFVLLLTATPHSGDHQAFHALCGIGALSGDDPVCMFRRNREEAGISRKRRVHLHRIEPAATERAVRRQLDDYIRTVWARRTGPEGRDARLAMIVLLKRSLSGMGPLHRSLVARLERLGVAPEPADVQLPLLWDEDDEADAEPAGVLGASGFDSEHEERRVLCVLADNAAAAAAHDSKQRALIGILRRVREPAIVFTEYRDTLEALRGVAGADTVVLHGAMDRFERAAAVGRFNGGGARVLLATDAAGEGLNLQPRCRLVINLELPWNPMRLEQRIGRVDRIGQHRTVHAINLVASGTAEPDILARLARRLDRARTAVGAIEDVLGPNDESVVAACLDLDGGFRGKAARPGAVSRRRVSDAVQRLDLARVAREAAEHLELRRQLLRASEAGSRRQRPGNAFQRSGGILVSAVRSSRLPGWRGRCGLLAIFRVRSAAHAGLAQHEELVPVFAEGRCPKFSRRRDIQARASDALATLVPVMAAAIPPRDLEGALGRDGFDRDARLAARASARRAVQRGLFERRAEREADEAHAEAAGPSNTVITEPPQPVLLIFLTS
jgi:superfamily II DNA or RNA helicase